MPISKMQPKLDHTTPTPQRPTTIIKLTDHKLEVQHKWSRNGGKRRLWKGGEYI